MKRRRPRTAALVHGLTLLLLASALPAVQEQVDARRGAARSSAVLMWSGSQLRRAAPGFHGLLADVYWLRTVQYFGVQHAFATDMDFTLLEPLIDTTVTLDPRLEIAYRYGSIFLAEPPPAGAGRPQAGVALLERGVRANPQNWRLRKELAYFHFLFLKDPATAARVLQEASEVPGAAYWLRTMAADFLARGGEEDQARVIWRDMYENSEGALKDNAALHLRLLDARDACRRLESLVEAFTRARGHRPASLSELHVSPAPPADPAGVPFDYDASTGNVSVSRSSPLWRPEQ